MIYTITFSPAIDYQMNMNSFEIGQINRSSYENITPGGKGINVSIVLKNLGHESVALGFVGGFTGNYILECLNNLQIKNDFVRVNGNSRINVKLVSGENETAINANGPRITEQDINLLLAKISCLRADDFLIISGNIPSMLPENIYERILSEVKVKVNIVIDATKDLLVNTLKYKPFLIKPNLEELAEIFDISSETLCNEDLIVEKARVLQAKGAKNVLVSLGKNGAILITDGEEVYKVSAYKGNMVNTVGAGDSMIAGFVASFLENHDYGKALQIASACGSATAFKEGLCNQDDVFKLLERNN